MLAALPSYRPHWTIAVGLLLFWVALDRLGVVVKCSLTGGLLAKLTIKGLSGALILGLAYGVYPVPALWLYRPILAIISVQDKLFTGIIFILVFAIGHCIPIVVAGSSTAMVKRLLTNSTWQQGGRFFPYCAAF